MAKPCARQEAYPPKTCNTAHVRYIKSKSYSAELRVGSLKSRFSYYEGYVYPEGVTSGDNIPPFGNESVETSFHWLMRRKMNWLTPASSSLSSGESTVSHKRQLPCADAKRVRFALSALPEQWVAGSYLCRCIHSCGRVIWENGTSQEDGQPSGSFHGPLIWTVSTLLWWREPLPWRPWVTA